MLFVGLKGDSKELGLDSMNHMHLNGDDLITSFEQFENADADAALDMEPPFYGYMFPSMKDPTYKDRYPG